ncbi:uncharacterized protein LOC122083438 isoform X1 [Macadamia integrifolia]|uniref:uncharacterized protein LOC122083438 isoform X1 n=1 Tax=Macadamia integrifolia TaxID=60698 RepID=UPI001C4E84CC|nr:uncharacterized protein LOC122083438 isoform X1 [Macadamia integrifolia]
MEERRLRSILFLVILSFLVFAVAGITEEELETAIGVLRSKGYNLFCNAIETSDILYELLDGNGDGGSGDSFTFFAPTDSSLYYLDLASQASDYIQTLRSHISPHRLTISDLQIVSMSHVPYLESLVPHHVLFIASNHTTEANFSATPLVVDGVPISIPDLYVGPGITAHGLNGIILSVRFQEGKSVSGYPTSLPPLLSPTMRDFIRPASFPAQTMQDLITPATSPAPKMQDSITPVSSLSPTIQDLITPASSPEPKMQELLTPDLTTPASFQAPVNVNSRFRKRGKHHAHRKRKKRQGKKVRNEYQKKYKDAVTGSDWGVSNSSLLYARV